MAHVIQPSGEDVVLCTACYLLILYDVRHTVRGADVHRLTRPRSGVVESTAEVDG